MPVSVWIKEQLQRKIIDALDGEHLGDRHLELSVVGKGAIQVRVASATQAPEYFTIRIVHHI